MILKKIISVVISLQIIAMSTLTAGAVSDNNDAQEQSNEVQTSSLGYEASQIYAGENHTVILNSNGLVETYGNNQYGQLGQTYSENGKEYVKDLNNVVKVSTYLNHNLALIDGEVFTWGDNSHSQLGKKGNNGIGYSVRFYENEYQPYIKDIEAGGWFSLALDNNGTIWVWGDNTYGQFSQGTTNGYSPNPHIAYDCIYEDGLEVSTLPDVIKISAGKYHALALDRNGRVHGWGRNSNDHCISEADTFAYSLAVQIQGLPNNIIGIEAGDRCSFFITDDGHVYAMGNNSTGQLGDGTNITRSTPVLLDIEDVVEVESNEGSTLFLKSNGDVYACGSNTYGQLGVGYTNTRRETPLKVPGGNYEQIAAGGNHNLLYKNGEIYAMGCNDSGQCISTIEGNITYPTLVNGDNIKDTGAFAWDENNIRPIDATYVVQHGTDNNKAFYGNSVLKVNYTERENDSNYWGEYAYLKFDVSNIAKEHIKSAKLNLYVENGDDHRQSTRTIGVYDTAGSDWYGQEMTWNNGRINSNSLLGSFEVTATGNIIEDVGWHEVDITDYLKNDCVDDKLSLMLKSISTIGYETTIASGIYDDSFTFEDKCKNRNIPVLTVEYETDEEMKFNRTQYTSSIDTYIYQRDITTNFSDSEFLEVNYTSDSSPNRYWGEDSYLSFDLGDISGVQRRCIKKATLWLYVDDLSDKRNSTRTINVSANDGLKYNPSNLTWNSGRLMGQENISDFTVSGNGFSVIDPGWRQVDITNFIKTAKNSDIEFILTMTSNNAHSVKIRSNEHQNAATRPRLVIDSNIAGIVDISDNYVTDTSSEISLYKYIPNRDDEYIFSSVGGEALSAILLNENMDELTISDNTNGEFNLSYELENNNVYYLEVSSDIADNEYKLYVETPLKVKIISENSNETEAIVFSQQRIINYLNIEMNYIGDNTVQVTGKTSPNSVIKFYDISDCVSGYDVADNEVLSEELLNKSILEGEYISQMETGRTLNFDGNIILPSTRTEYTLAAVLYESFDEDTYEAVTGKAKIVSTTTCGDMTLNEFSVDNGHGTVTNLYMSSSPLPAIAFHENNFKVKVDFGNKNYPIDKVYIEMFSDDNRIIKHIEAISQGNGKYIAKDHIEEAGELDKILSSNGTIRLLVTYKDDTSGEKYTIYSTRVKFLIDPSGYIYEGVPSNRLENVKTTLYYKDQNGNVNEWDSEGYSQQNPIFTNIKGEYEWFVPLGMWQVKAELNGYETYYSDWFSVPPVQKDVNFGMISKKNPTVINAITSENGIEIEFDKYMRIDDITKDNIAIFVNNRQVESEIVLLNVEKDYWQGIGNPQMFGGTGNNYVSKVKVIPDVSLTGNDSVKLVINGDVRSYANVEMSCDYEKEICLKDE